MALAVVNKEEDNTEVVYMELDNMVAVCKEHIEAVDMEVGMVLGSRQE